MLRKPNNKKGEKVKYIKNLINNILCLFKCDIKLVNDIKSINTSIYEMENALSHHIKKIDKLNCEIAEQKQLIINNLDMIEKNMINNKIGV